MTGFTRIPNEILRDIASGTLLPSVSQCLIFIWRKIAGWGKTDWEWISQKQFQDATRLSTKTVSFAIKMLKKKKYIEVKVEQRRNHFKLLKGYQGVTYNELNVTSDRQDRLPTGNTTKETLTKENTLSDESESEHKKIIAYFNQQFLDKTGERYLFEGVIDGIVVKKLLKFYGFDRLAKKIDMFFSCGDAWVEEAGYRWTILDKKKNSLIEKEEGDSSVPI